MMPGPIECYAVMDGDVPLGFHASGESASTIASIFRLPVVPGYFVPREHVCEDYWKLFDKHGNLVAQSDCRDALARDMRQGYSLNRVLIVEVPDA